MITIHTQTRSTSLLLSKLRASFGDIKYSPTALLSEGEYNELLAYLNGEKQTNYNRLRGAFMAIRKEYEILPFKRNESHHSVKIIGTDDYMYISAGIFQHFTLLRDYFDEYPDHESIT